MQPSREPQPDGGNGKDSGPAVGTGLLDSKDSQDARSGSAVWVRGLWRELRKRGGGWVG